METVRNIDGNFFDMLKQIERDFLESLDDPEAKECLRAIDEEEERFQKEYEKEMLEA
jgi:hypothetical protein